MSNSLSLATRLSLSAAALAFGTIAAFAQADPATPLPPKRPPVAASAPTAAPAMAGKPAPAKAAPAAAAPIQTAALAQPFNPAALTAPQRDALQRIDNYFNGVRVMSGTFVQVGPDGGRSEGQFWVSKPGKMRFQYAPPSPVELVADGRSVAVRNRKLNTQDLYFIGQTPLRFLLADRLDLIQDADLVGLSGDKNGVTVTLEEKSAVGGSARIALVFDTSYQLKQWTVTDAQGFDTTVAIYDVDTTSQPNNKLFYIDELRSR